MRRRFFVYILLCSDGSYYTGITNNIRRRLTEHQRGHNETCYTASRRPLELVYCRIFKYVLNAIAWEKQLKGWGRKKKEALMRGEYDKLHALAKKDFRKRKRRPACQASLRPSARYRSLGTTQPDKRDNAISQ